MKKFIFVSIVLNIFSALSYAQVFDCGYYDFTDQHIDKSYEKKMQEWNTNYEWQQTENEFLDIWKAQADYEFVRLYYSLDKKGKASLKKMYDSFLEMIKTKKEFIFGEADIDSRGGVHTPMLCIEMKGM